MRPRAYDERKVAGERPGRARRCSSRRIEHCIQLRDVQQSFEDRLAQDIKASVTTKPYQAEFATAMSTEALTGVLDAAAFSRTDGLVRHSLTVSMCLMICSGAGRDSDSDTDMAGFVRLKGMKVDNIKLLRYISSCPIATALRHGAAPAQLQLLIVFYFHEPDACAVRPAQELERVGHTVFPMGTMWTCWFRGDFR